MTPERWRRIDDLFDSALRLGPAEREAWLHEASASDADLRREVGRLVAHDNRAEAEGFLAPPLATERLSDQTGSWTPSDKGRPSDRLEPVDQVEQIPPPGPAASPTKP